MSYPHQKWPVAHGGNRRRFKSEKNKIGQKPCTSLMQKWQVAGMCLSQTRFEINRSIEGV